MAEAVSYYFEVANNQTQYFQCEIKDGDAYGGGFQCIPMADGSTQLEFYNGGDKVSKSQTLKTGSYYRLSVSDDYRLTLSEYTEDGKLGKTIFDQSLESSSPDFANLQKKPVMSESVLHFKSGSGSKQVYVGADGKIVAEAPETTEEAATTTTTTTTTTITTTKQSEKKADSSEQTHASVVHTTDPKAGGLVDKMMSVDINTLIWSIIVMIAVLIGVIVLYVKFAKKKAEKQERESRNQTVTVTPKNTIMKPAYLSDLEPEEWDAICARAHQECPAGMKVHDYAAQLGSQMLREREAQFGKTDIGGGQHLERMSSIGKGITPESTGGSYKPKQSAEPDTDSGFIHVPSSLPETNGRNPHGIHQIAPNGPNGTFVPQTADEPEPGTMSIPAGFMTGSDDDVFGSSQQNSSDVMTPPVSAADDLSVTPVSPSFAPESGQQDGYGETTPDYSDSIPSVPTAPDYSDSVPSVPTAPPAPPAPQNDWVDWSECEQLASGAKCYIEERQFDGSYLIRESSGSGSFIGLPYVDGSIQLYLNPAEFSETYPFYEYGVAVVEQFFNGAMLKGKGVIRLRAAVCAPAPGFGGMYQCIQKGEIEQEQ